MGPQVGNRFQGRGEKRDMRRRNIRKSLTPSPTPLCTPHPWQPGFRGAHICPLSLPGLSLGASIHGRLPPGSQFPTIRRFQRLSTPCFHPAPPLTSPALLLLMTYTPGPMLLPAGSITLSKNFILQKTSTISQSRENSLVIPIYIPPAVNNYQYFVHFILLCACLVTSVMSNSLPLHGVQSANLLCPWNFHGKNTEVGYHALLLGNLSNPGIQPMSFASPALAGRFFTTEPPGKSFVLFSHRISDIFKS